MIHARDPEGESEAIDEIFATLDARAAGHAGDPPLLLGPAAGRRRGRARLVLLLRRQRHLPQRPRRCASAAAKVPEDRILVETDAPYLAPQALRGKRNEPANVVATARVVAEVRGVSYEELERTVEANARALFGW